MSDTTSSQDPIADPPDGTEPDVEAIRGALLSATKVEGQSGEQLLKLLYDQLRFLAAKRMRGLAAGQTLQATALVHEAYMRLVRNGDPGWDGKAHFYGAAAQAMRDIVVDRARARGAKKRGGDRQRSSDSFVAELSHDEPGDEVLAIHEALQALEQEDPRGARVVSLRYFAGLSMEEIAKMIGYSLSSAERDWRFARTWLRRHLGQ